jgi:hypothetical protein
MSDRERRELIAQLTRVLVAFMPAVEGRELRDLDHELRLGFEKGRNLLALHTALRVAYDHPLKDEHEPYPNGTGTHAVPTWVLHACYNLVTAQLKRPAGTGTGQHARWLTRYRQEVLDQRRWTVVRWCQSQGLSLEEALGAASAYLGTPEKTLEKAVGRAEALRVSTGGHAVFQPWDEEPGSGGYVDPLAEEIDLRITAEDSPKWFAGLMRACAARPRSDVPQEEGRLLAAVEAARAARQQSPKARRARSASRTKRAPTK